MGHIHQILKIGVDETSYGILTTLKINALTVFICFIWCLDVLQWYFKGRLEELSEIMASGSEYDNKLSVDDEGDQDCRRVEMDIDENQHQRIVLGNNKLVKNIGEVVRDLRHLGFTSMAEDAYASAIFLLLKVHVC